MRLLLLLSSCDFGLYLRCRLVPSGFAIFDLEPLSLSFDFVFNPEIINSLSFLLDHLYHLAILCLAQHAHTLHHLESLLTISYDRLDILNEDLIYQKEIQQAAREEAWVPKADRVKISTTNMRIHPTINQKEETYQVVLNIIKNTTFYTAFLASADVSKSYMQRFWFTVTKIKKTNFYEFKLANKKCQFDVEVFHKALNICLRVQGKEFIEPPSEEKLLTFLIGLRYKGQLKKGRHEIMSYPRFTKIIINHFVSIHKSIPKGLHSSLYTIKDDGVQSRMKFVRIREDFQEYGQPGVTFELGKSMSLTEKKTSGIAFRDTSSVSKKISPDQPQKLKGIQTLIAEEQLAADTMQALIASKQSSISQPHVGGSSERTGVLLGVPDELTLIHTTSSKGTSTKPEVLDEEETVDEEVEWLYSDEEEEKTDDRSIDIENTNDDVENDDEFVHGDEYVHEEMKDAEDAETRKDDEGITDAEKTEVAKGDLEQPRKLPLTSSSLSVLYGFGNQILNLSSDTSLIGTIKEFADNEINSLLDIQIQQEVPHVHSPFILTVPVFVIPKPTFFSPIPEIPSVAPATTLLPPLSVSTISLVLQQTATPILTPPITTEAPATTTVLDPLSKIAQRVSVLEKDVQELKKVGHSLVILATTISHVPAAIDEYLESSLGDALQKVLQKHTEELIQQTSQKYVFEITKIKQEEAAKEQIPKFSATPYDQAVEAECKQNEILFKMTREYKSHKKHLKHKALYDVLVLSLIQDEDDLDRVILDLRKRDLKEATHKVTMGDEEPVQENVNDVDQPQDGESAPNNDWFKQPPRPSTLDLEWNKCQVVDDQPEQPWLNNMLSATKDPLTFDELMETPIDFSKFVMNRLKIEKLTKAHLVGPVYNLLKDTCQRDRCPFDLSKPLPLKGHPCHLTVALEYFFNNDFVYLKSSFLKKVYYVYHEDKGCKIRVDKLHGYGYLEEIMVRRADRQIYKFKEGDFMNLHLNDIEDMLLLVVQQNLFHLDGEVIVDLAVALRMFTRSLIIKKRVEYVQMGVESYKKKLNITKPQKDFLGISAKEPYTPSFEPHRVVYEDLSHQKMLMRADELYKFSDGTLKKVRNTLHHRLRNFDLDTTMTCLGVSGLPQIKNGLALW
nr:hypothetical protein [Tanacetum cinerariifolium]